MNTQNPETPLLQTGLPWYRHPTVLLIVAIPSVAVIVGFAMLAIAFATFDGVVVDDYYKHGKGINQVLHRDENARALGIVADIAFNERSITAELHADKAITWPETLSLGILHPTQAGRDIVVELTQVADQRYSADQVAFNPGEWILQIDTAQWRLSNRVSIAENAALKIQ